MKLESKDIEAVAKSRASRAEGKTMLYWMIGVAVLVMAGIYVVRSNTMAGWALCIIGVIGFLYYQNTLTKKQNALKYRLLKEWQAEELHKGETEKK